MFMEDACTLLSNLTVSQLSQKKRYQTNNVTKLNLNKSKSSHKIHNKLESAKTDTNTISILGNNIKINGVSRTRELKRSVTANLNKRILTSNFDKRNHSLSKISSIKSRNFIKNSDIIKGLNNIVQDKPKYPEIPHYYKVMSYLMNKDSKRYSTPNNKPKVSKLLIQTDAEVNRMSKERMDKNLIALYRMGIKPKIWKFPKYKLSKTLLGSILDVNTSSLM